MPTRLHWFPIVSLALLIGPIPARAADPATPLSVVQRFLDWEARVQPSGAYPEYLTPELTALLSSELSCQLRAAVQAKDWHRRHNPDDKPPFVEGNLFLPSAWERPTETRITRSQAQGGQAGIDAQFSYGPELRMSSTFQLQRLRAGWRITDIVLGGTCDFCQRGSLREAMYATLKFSPQVGGDRCRPKTSGR